MDFIKLNVLSCADGSCIRVRPRPRWRCAGLCPMLVSLLLWEALLLVVQAGVWFALESMWLELKLDFSRVCAKSFPADARVNRAGQLPRDRRRNSKNVLPSNSTHHLDKLSIPSPLLLHSPMRQPFRCGAQ